MIRSSEPLGERDLRQRQIVPPERLAACHALVIGVGAIGRQVALQLAAVGAPRLTLFDDDVVAVENLAPQGYWPSDLGTLKVHATRSLCERVNPDVQVTAVGERFRRSAVRAIGLDDSQLVVFACVDSIATRKLLWESLRQRADLYLDGRMSAEVVRVLAVESPLTDRHYATTLFDPREAYVGSCTAKATIYTASIAAGLMLGQWTKWLRGFPVEADLTLNLLSMDLSVATTL